MNEETLLYFLGRGHFKFAVLFAHPEPPSRVDPAVVAELEARLDAFVDFVFRRAACFAMHRTKSPKQKGLRLTAQDVTMAWKSIEMSFH